MYFERTRLELRQEFNLSELVAKEEVNKIQK